MPAPAPTPAPAPATQTAQYTFLADPGDSAGLVSQANGMGAQGAAFVTGLANATSRGLLYVKDGSRPGAQLQYSFLTGLPTGVADFVAYLNARGAQGLAYKSEWVAGSSSGSIFVRDSARPSTYSYAADASTNNLQGDLAQMNARGATGYRYLGPLVLAGAPGIVNLYAKTSTDAARYSYSATADAGSGGALANLLNQAGIQGQILVGPMLIGSGGAQLLFEKPSSQGAISYVVDAAATGETPQAATARHNVRGAQGYLLVTDLAYGGAAYSVYAKGLAATQRMPLGGIVYP